MPRRTHTRRVCEGDAACCVTALPARAALMLLRRIARRLCKIHTAAPPAGHHHQTGGALLLQCAKAVLQRSWCRDGGQPVARLRGQQPHGIQFVQCKQHLANVNEAVQYPRQSHF